MTIHGNCPTLPGYGPGFRQHRRPEFSRTRTPRTMRKDGCSVFDRRLSLHGDSLYEVCRSGYGGRLFAVKEHLDRLEKSAALCQMTFSQPIAEYADQMHKTVTAFHRAVGHEDTEIYCRLIVSRGVGRIGFGLRCLESPTQYAIIVQPLDEPTREQFEKGLALQFSHRLRNDRRALDPAMKSGNYLNSLLAFLDASREDFDDAILCNAEDHVTEGTTFNVGYIRNGILATPPLDIGILDGITRRRLLKHAERIGLRVREVRFPRNGCSKPTRSLCRARSKRPFRSHGWTTGALATASQALGPASCRRHFAKARCASWD